MKGQSDNTAWFQFRKGTITASKSHEIKTNVGKWLGECVELMPENIWLNQH